MSKYQRGKTNLDPEMQKMLITKMQEVISALPPNKQQEAMKKIESDYSGFIKITIDSVANKLHTKSQRTIKRSIKLNHKDKKRFEKKLYKTHKRLFDKVEEVIGISTDAVDQHRELMSKSIAKKDSVYGFLIRLHGLLLLNASEILSLSMSGYGMAAKSRWRSMHETNVLLQYMRERGNSAFKLFKDHDVITRYKSMLSYNEHSEALGNKPFSKGEVASAKKKYARRLNKYGKSFAQDYGWLKVDSNGRLNNFRDMEEYVGVDHLRPYYRFTSLDIHTNWSSLTSGVVFDTLKRDNILLVGAADHGFEDAIDLAVNTLVHATVSILTYNQSWIGLIYASVLMNAQQEEQLLLEEVIRYKRDNFGLFPDANLSSDKEDDNE